MSKLFEKGRLASQREDVVSYTSSAKDDIKLLESIVAINKAHVVMMFEEGIIEKRVAATLLQALSKPNIGKSQSKAEDIHMAIEEEVTDSAGELGGNLHIGKSRNDQVAAAIRMTLRSELITLMQTLLNLQESILETAKKHVNTIVPGYTHTQPAQPITFAHYLTSFFEAFNRDLDRLNETLDRVNKSPMGAGALATTSFPIDRERVAELLGFKGLVENSLDAVGSRDFILETQSHLTLLASTVSRLAEDLILWSSVNFEIIILPDNFSSTSSIMPQKKNADVLEVIRARTSDVLGNLTATYTTLKGLPSGYNMDLQEITPKLWNSIDHSTDALNMLKEIIPLLEINDSSDKLVKDYATTTEIANLLTRKYDVAFRTAHKVVGSLVREMFNRKLTFNNSIADLLESILAETAGKRFKIQEEDIASAVNPTSFVRAHNVTGGPAPREITRMLQNRDLQMIKTRETLEMKTRHIESSLQNLKNATESIL